MTHPPQGWYPDPSGQASFRRWDGEKWSDLTSEDPSSPASVTLSVLPAPPVTASPNGLFSGGPPSPTAPSDEATAPASFDEIFPTRPASPATIQRRRWRKALAWTLIATALLIQLGAIGMLVVENLSLEAQILEQRNEIETLKREHEEEAERLQQEANTQATAWCAGVSAENRRSVPELFMKYQRAERLTQEATQKTCADRVAIAHAVAVVDFSLLESVSIDECTQIPGQDLAIVRGSLTYTGPTEARNVSETLSTGDIWIDVALVGTQNSSPLVTTHLEEVAPGQQRDWELTLPFGGVTEIHSCRIHSVSWWPSNAR